MAEPTKQEIQQVFKRLKAVGPNKVSYYLTKLPVITSKISRLGENCFISMARFN